MKNIKHIGPRISKTKGKEEDLRLELNEASAKSRLAHYIWMKYV